jgi:hypothetical protein
VKPDIRARVSNLIKNEAEWSKLDLKFTPLPGELVVYAPENPLKSPRIKIGDGKHTLHELPFVIEATVTALLEKYQRSEELDAGNITDYFN